MFVAEPVSCMLKIQDDSRSGSSVLVTVLAHALSLEHCCVCCPSVSLSKSRRNYYRLLNESIEHATDLSDATVNLNFCDVVSTLMNVLEQSLDKLMDRTRECRSS